MGPDARPLTKVQTGMPTSAGRDYVHRRLAAGKTRAEVMYPPSFVPALTALAVPSSDEELRMDLLGVILWGSAAGAVASVAVAVIMTSRRRAALLVASLLFLVAGVLGILSIGIVFVAAAIVCAVVALRAPRTDGRGRALTAD